MKKTILVALIWTACLAACNKDDPDPDIQFEGNASKVAYRQNTVVPASGSDLTVSLKEVVDSRCPSNANCITMGAAALTFAISNGTDNADVKASFSANSKDSAIQTFSLGNRNYALKVTEVLPYPETSQTPKLEDYKVGVSIVKL
jgi:hypothetical protein